MAMSCNFNAVANDCIIDLTGTAPVHFAYPNGNYNESVVERIKKMGFETVSPRWRELSYELCLDATTAMANSTGYFPAWDALLGKRFDKQIDSQIPITIVFGDSDHTLPAKTCQERSLAPAHAKWIILPQTGHAPALGLGAAHRPRPHLGARRRIDTPYFRQAA